MHSYIVFCAFWILFGVSKVCGQTPHSIKVRVTNLVNSPSKVLLAVYDSPEHFLSEERYQRHIIDLSSEGEGTIEIELPSGYFAIAAFQDMNRNNSFDKNFFGYPLERYGFSNNPEVIYRAPRWSEAALMVNKSGVMEIQLR